MKIDFQRRAAGWVQRPEWLAGFLVATGASLVAWLLAFAFGGPGGPGSAWGRTFGALAALLMLAAALLGVRRRLMRLSPFPIGRAQDWVQFHVYGGGLALLLVFFHTGLRPPAGGLGFWLLALSVWVTLSGLLGVGLRKWIPRLLSSALDLEVLYERIPELSAQVRARAEVLVRAASGPVRDFYSQRLAADLAEPRVRLIYFLDITGGIQGKLRELAFLRKLLSPAEQPQLDELEAVYRTKLELDAHFTLQRALRGWLYAHVPVSLVLLLLVAIHIFAVLYY